jgi:hypothetical protein
MSDEPSKRSRAWFGLGLALVIAMYPLAVGPLDCIYRRCGDYPRLQAALRVTYSPLLFFCDRSTKTNAFVGWYLAIWHRMTD